MSHVPQEIHVGDTDTALVLRIYDKGDDVEQDPEPPVLDLSSASAMLMRITDPDGNSTDETATFTDLTGLPGYVGDGTDGYMQYRTEADTFDEAGAWRIQGIVTIGSGTWYTNVVELEVHENLPAPP